MNVFFSLFMKFTEKNLFLREFKCRESSLKDLFFSSFYSELKFRVLVGYQYLQRIIMLQILSIRQRHIFFEQFQRQQFWIYIERLDGTYTNTDRYLPHQRGLLIQTHRTPHCNVRWMATLLLMKLLSRCNISNRVVSHFPFQQKAVRCR